MLCWKHKLQQTPLNSDRFLVQSHIIAICGRGALTYLLPSHSLRETEIVFGHQCVKKHLIESRRLFTLLVYPNHNSPFEVYTDTSDNQMGAAIVQNGHPLAY